MLQGRCAQRILVRAILVRAAFRGQARAFSSGIRPFIFR